MLKDEFQTADVKLFRDMTAPLEAVRAYADEDMTEGETDLEGASPEEAVMMHRPDG